MNCEDNNNKSKDRYTDFFIMYLKFLCFYCVLGSLYFMCLFAYLLYFLLK